MTTNYRDGDNLLINGRKCYIGTVVGYAQQYNEDPIAAVDRARANGHKLHWIGLHATTIADAAFYARERTKWAGASELSTGDLIKIDGIVFTLAPDHNENFKLVPVATDAGGTGAQAAKAVRLACIDGGSAPRRVVSDEDEANRRPDGGVLPDAPRDGGSFDAAPVDPEAGGYVVLFSRGAGRLRYLHHIDVVTNLPVAGSRKAANVMPLGYARVIVDNLRARGMQASLERA